MGTHKDWPASRRLELNMIPARPPPTVPTFTQNPSSRLGKGQEAEPAIGRLCCRTCGGNSTWATHRPSAGLPCWALGRRVRLPTPRRGGKAHPGSAPPPPIVFYLHNDGNTPSPSSRLLAPARVPKASREHLLQLRKLRLRRGGVTCPRSHSG